jgi:hypothetical protein
MLGHFLATFLVLLYPVFFAFLRMLGGMAGRSFWLRRLRNKPFFRLKHDKRIPVNPHRPNVPQEFDVELTHRASA